METEFMKEAIDASKINAKNNFNDGGPFGAVIVKNGEIIAKSFNKVIKDCDPTAHAEIKAIREAAKVLKTHDLKGCELYTSCFPCPMCAAAIIWANIDKVYYANTKEDASDIGFRDEDIYQFFKSIDENETDFRIEFKQLDKEEAIKVFADYKNNNKKIRY